MANQPLKQDFYDVLQCFDGDSEAGSAGGVHGHYPRENRVAYTKRMMKNMETFLKGSTAFAIRTPHVLFLIASQPKDERVIAQALACSFKLDPRFKSKNKFEFHNEFLVGD